MLALELQIIFLIFLDCFDLIMSKINFKNEKIYYFIAFPSENHFEKQFLPQS
jgi:hypothetical protein